MIRVLKYDFIVDKNPKRERFINLVKRERAEVSMSKDILELTEGIFDASVKKGSWIIDFWTVWCGPCKLMAPHFEAAAKELKGKVQCAKVNVDENYALAERFGIMAVPTTLFFSNGELVEQTTGALTIEQILKKAKEVL